MGEKVGDFKLINSPLFSCCQCVSYVLSYRKKIDRRLLGGRVQILSNSSEGLIAKRSFDFSKAC